MAAIAPTEGLDYLVKLVVEGATAPATLYLGLFTGGTGTTVPAATATRASMGAPFAEANGTTYPGYAAVAITANTDWGVVGAKTVQGDAMRGSDAVQKSFAAASGAAASANITGYFIATDATAGVVLAYSNFTDGAADVIASLALGDIVRVTPTFGVGDPAGVA